MKSCGMCVCGWVSHCHLLTVWTAATRFTFTYLPEVYSSTRVVSPRTQSIRFSSFFALSPCVLCFLTLSKAQHAHTHTHAHTHVRQQHRQQRSSQCSAVFSNTRYLACRMNRTKKKEKERGKHEETPLSSSASGRENKLVRRCGKCTAWFH